MGEALDTNPEQAAALAARPVDAPVVMINLLKFKAEGGLRVLPAVRTRGRAAPTARRRHRPLRGNRAGLHHRRRRTPLVGRDSRCRVPHTAGIRRHGVHPGVRQGA